MPKDGGASGLLGTLSPSELLPRKGKPLRLARFLMEWLSGTIQDDVLPCLSQGDARLLQRSPTRASLDMLCCSMNLDVWQYATALLEKEAAFLAEKALLNPTYSTFQSLNHCRQRINRWISFENRPASRFSLKRLSGERKTLVELCGYLVDPQNHEWLSAEDFEDEARIIQEKLAALESQVKETFTLLVQAVTVIDSDANRKAATQASLLTLLAALYLPATLATGIFGMNVKLFTDDSNAADWRPVIYTFLVVLAPSLAFITFVFLPKRYKQLIRGGVVSGMEWCLVGLRDLIRPSPKEDTNSLLKPLIVNL